MVVLTNKAEVYAVNYLFTNSAYTNILTAEIHGIIDLVATNTNVSLLPGQSYSFWSSFSNAANIRTTNIVMTLTNYATNAGIRTGNWQISVLDITNGFTNVLLVTNSYALPASIKLRPSIAIAPDEVYWYGIKLNVATNADVGSWASVNLLVKALTNVSRYTAGGTWYGGKTNLLNRAKAIIFTLDPLVSLSKSITFITNVRYGNNSLMPGADIHYTIRFTNIGTGSGKNLRIRDILPSRNIAFSNGFVYSGFGTNFSAEFSSDQGFSWTYLPAVWDTNVNQIHFDSTNIFTPGAAGSIRYKVRIR